MVIPWSYQSQQVALRMSPKRRMAWEECVSRSRALEQKLHTVYGLSESPRAGSASMQSGGSTSTAATRRSPRGASRSSPTSRCSSQLGGDTSRCRSADCGTPLGEFQSLRDDAVFIARLEQEVRDGTASRYSDLKTDSRDTKLASKSGTLSSKTQTSRWNVPPLEPILKASVPCDRVRPSCWSPFSREHGGRYSSSPGPPNANGKAELAKFSYITLQSIDGKAMRVHTPDLEQGDRRFQVYPGFRWKPWLHCTARPS